MSNRFSWTGVPQDISDYIAKESEESELTKSEIVTKYVRLGLTVQDSKLAYNGPFKAMPDTDVKDVVELVPGMTFYP